MRGAGFVCAEQLSAFDNPVMQSCAIVQYILLSFCSLNFLVCIVSILFIVYVDLSTFILQTLLLGCVSERTNGLLDGNSNNISHLRAKLTKASEIKQLLCDHDRDQNHD